MNEGKIAFIICCNNEILISECKLYIDRLHVPEGVTVDFVVIRGAKSMLEGMEKGKSQTDAKYKVYMHQDVFILNKYFIDDIISIFSTENDIGMVGMVGVDRFPDDGMWVDENRLGFIYRSSNVNANYDKYRYNLEDSGWYVDVVDGMLMATCVDIDFRKELFDGWDFYDVSTCLEYRRAGYKIFVPYQECPWVLHDDGEILSLWNYNKYRKIAISEYCDLTYKTSSYEEELERLNYEIDKYFQNPSDSTIDCVYKELLSDEGQLVTKNNREIRELYKFLRIYYWEKETKETTIFNNITCIDDLNVLARNISMLLYRLAVDNYDDYTFQLFDDLRQRSISSFAYSVFSKYLNYNQDEVLVKVANMYEAVDEKLMAIKILNVGLKFYDNSKAIILKLANMYLDMGMINEAKALIDNSSLMDDLKSANGV